MEDAFLSNCLQVNDHQGNKGPKDSWGSAHMCVYAHRLIGLSVCVADRILKMEIWQRERRWERSCGLDGGKPGTPQGPIRIYEGEAPNFGGSHPIH